MAFMETDANASEIESQSIQPKYRTRTTIYICEHDKKTVTNF